LRAKAIGSRKPPADFPTEQKKEGMRDEEENKIVGFQKIE